jgi:hypothetical protein
VQNPFAAETAEATVLLAELSELGLHRLFLALPYGLGHCCAEL